ncbi:hypothetical protein D3846_04735 [Streptococcus mutans]|nr:hypothetical protein [Streptococcus mutans]
MEQNILNGSYFVLNGKNAKFLLEIDKLTFPDKLATLPVPHQVR